MGSTRHSSTSRAAAAAAAASCCKWARSPAAAPSRPTAAAGPTAATAAIQASSVSILNGAMLTHQAPTATQEYALRLTLTGALMIDATSKIDVTGQGYRPGYTLGNTTVGGATTAGGSYGGLANTSGR